MVASGASLLKRTGYTRWNSILLFTASVLSLASIQSEGAAQLRSRAEFTTALAKIKEGVAEKEVLNLLGNPDDVRTQFDPGGISRVHTREIWCYGAKAHLSFPTLGCVYIDEDGRTQEVFGGNGQPPKPDMFTEDELRDLLRLLDTAPGLDGYSYNPLPVITIANTLQPLGKEKALAAIAEYIRVSSKWSGFGEARYGIFLVLRVLFDVPGSVDPIQAVAFGAPFPPGPKDPHRLPRFPIALVDDIPLMLVSGYSLAGMATPMEEVVAFFRDNGELHPTLLAPTNAPLSAIVHLMHSSQWVYADAKLQQPGGFSFGMVEDTEREKSMLMEQLLRLIDSVHRLPTDQYGNRLPCGEPPEPAWQNIVAEVSALQIKWAPKQNLFVFPDGTHLPLAANKIYRRQIWKLTGIGFEDGELVLERKNQSWVEVMVSHSDKAGAALRPATLFLFDSKNMQSPISTFSFASTAGSGGSTFESRTIGLRTNSEVTATLVIMGFQTNSSPVLRP